MVGVKHFHIGCPERGRIAHEDLPRDFEANREGYYRLLCQPREAETFVGKLRRRMTDAPENLDRGMPKNRDVRILDRGNGWISLSPLKAQPEPPNIIRLKAEVARRWPMTSLLTWRRRPTCGSPSPRCLAVCSPGRTSTASRFRSASCSVSTPWGPTPASSAWPPATTGRPTTIFATPVAGSSITKSETPHSAGRASPIPESSEPNPTMAQARASSGD